MSIMLVKMILPVFIFYSLVSNFGVDSKHIVKRMVGGYFASPGQFPFQISIRNKYDDHICGGTIIHERFVLTAAHCLEKRHPRDIYIVAGTNKLSESEELNIYNVTKIAHGNYNSTDISNDISIIKLSEDIIFTELVQPLPFYKSEPPVDVPMTVSGWGYRHFGDFEPSNELKFVEVKAISLDECIERFSNVETVRVLTEKNICTFSKYGEGICFGDSGGPLVYDGMLVGIISYGKPCAIGYPDVFTKVSEYYNWIQAAMSVM